MRPDELATEELASVWRGVTRGLPCLNTLRKFGDKWIRWTPRKINF